jgi:peptidyl-prolyl cis-trans isomerase D
MMQGKLDEKKAREMGLIKQAFSTLAVQAKILNFAKILVLLLQIKK